MTVNALDLAGLLCSRLCHDLLSPVGAMNNGLELLADENDPGMRAQVMELLADSAATSASKLKFFRLAFGAAGGFGDMVDVREARSAIEGLFGRDKKVTVEWLVEAEMLPKAAVKVLLNLVLLASDTLVRGGTLAIGAEQGATQSQGTEIVVRAEGQRLVLDPEIAKALQDGIDEGSLSPRTAAAWVVRQMAMETGGHAQVVAPDPTVLLFGATLGS